MKPYNTQSPLLTKLLSKGYTIEEAQEIKRKKSKAK